MSSFAPPPSGPISPKFIRFRSGDLFVKVVEIGNIVLGFQYNEAIGPFDHHLVGEIERGCYYCSPYSMEKDDNGLALGLECSIVERFSRTQELELSAGYEFAFIKAETTLTLLDLRTDSDLTAAGTALGGIYTNDFLLSQSWSRYFYDNSAQSQYGQLDGLVYATNCGGKILSSAVFYERAEMKLSDSKIRISLNAPQVIKQVYAIAGNNMIDVI